MSSFKFRNKLIRAMFEKIQDLSHLKQIDAPERSYMDNPLRTFSLWELSSIVEFLQAFDHKPSAENPGEISVKEFWELKFVEGERRRNGSKVLTTKSCTSKSEAEAIFHRKAQSGAEFVSLKRIITTHEHHSLSIEQLAKAA